MSDFRAGVRFANTASILLKRLHEDWVALNPERYLNMYEILGESDSWKGISVLVLRRRLETLMTGSREYAEANISKWDELAKNYEFFEPSFPAVNDFERGIAFVVEHFEVGGFNEAGEIQTVIGDDWEDHRLTHFKCLVNGYKWCDPKSIGLSSLSDHNR